MWNNDHLISLVLHNRQAIMPLIVPALERNIHSHWNQAVLNLTRNVKKMLREMDEELFSACEDNFEQEEMERKMVEEKRRIAWHHLETIAFQPLTGNTPVLIRPPLVSPVVAAARS